MSKCIDCCKFDLLEQKCGVELDVSPIKKCVVAIIEKEISSLSNKIILEIGCSRWTFIRNICLKNGCVWKSVDIDRQSLATDICSVVKMPFENNYFDYAVGVQTIEHWNNPKEGLAEINRVLKPNAELLVTFPIHLHGNKIFINGEIEKIFNLFDLKIWSNFRYEEWRKVFSPLPSYVKIDKYPSVFVMEVKVKKYQALFV